MAEYDLIGLFGSISFNISDVSERQQHATLKQKLGKTFIEKRIPMKNDVNFVLDITGVINGTTSGNIQTDRASLTALEDGDKHAYSDGKHSFDGAIVTGSLKWEDSADRVSGQPQKFSCTIISW